MYMKMLERILLCYFSSSKIKMEITGFDMEAFSKAMNQELADRLNAIEYIVFEDAEVMSPEEKIESIQVLFQHDFLE